MICVVPEKKFSEEIISINPHAHSYIKRIAHAPSEVFEYLLESSQR